MKIVLISGSSRKDSQTLKVTQWLEQKLQSDDVQTEIVDLQEYNLPIVHDDIWADINDHPEAVRLRQVLDSGDGFVVATPEWSGMASPALKNMFIFVQKTMEDKASMLVGVSAAVGGAYPITELRATTYKNTHVNYIPEQLIIRDAKNVLNTPEVTDGEKADQYLKARAVYALEILKAYTTALASVRDSGVRDNELYPNGM